MEKRHCLQYENYNMSSNELESPTSIDFEVTNKFEQLSKFCE